MKSFLNRRQFAVFWMPAGILLFLTFTSPNSFGQGDFNKKLEKIDSDIRALRTELSKIERREGDYFSEIESIDKEVILLSRKYNLYREEENRLSRSIAERERKIGDLRKERSRLRRIYEHQVVSSYLFYHRKDDWLVFDWSAPLESLRRYRYFKIIAEHEKKLAKHLASTQDQLEQEKRKLSLQMAEKHKLISQITAQLAELTTVRNEKRELIRKLRNSKNARRLAIQKLENSKQQLIALIRKSEEQRKARKKGTETITERKWIPLKGNFSKNKGKINWPVSGKVITKFGKYKDPVLKTTLKNTGIDIAAEFGKPIRAIYNGRVSLITFMAGYGNTLILEHGNGYYSVYSHLNEIYVKQGDVVDAGTTIATVGDSGSLTGPKLHFELYAKQKPVNPLSWLRK